MISSSNNGHDVVNSIHYSGITARYNNFRQNVVKTYLNIDSSARWDGEVVNNDYIAPKTGYFVVNRVDSDINSDTAVSVIYQYGGLLMHKKGHGNLGFEVLRTIDPQTCTQTREYVSQYMGKDSEGNDLFRKVLVEYTNYDNCITTETVYNQRFPYTGMPKWTTQTLGAKDGAPVISKATNTWSEQGSANGGVSVYLQRSEEHQYSLSDDLSSSTLLSRTTTTNAQDSYGNVTGVTVVMDDGSTSTANTHYTHTSNVYGSSTTHKKLGRLSKTTVTKRLTKNGIKAPVNGVAGDIVRTSSFTYNSDLMLNTSVTELGTTTYGYDQWGNKTAETFRAADATNSASNERVSSVQYYAGGRYVKSKTGADNITTTYVYNHSSSEPKGRIKSLTTSDTNGNYSTTQFGDFDKPGLKTSQAGSSPITLQSRTYTQYCSNLAGACPAGAFIRTTQVASGVPEKQVFIDRFGREVRSQVQNFKNTWTVIDKTYDEQGRAKTVSEPGFGAGSSHVTELFYDRIGRVIKESRPTGDVTTSRQGLVTVHYDEQANDTSSEWAQMRRVTRDFTGQVVLSESLDNTGAVIASTAMHYSANNELVKSVVNGVEVNAITYDHLGRKTKMTDDTKGTWQYSYNGFGQLVWQQNSDGHTTHLYYDGAGRKTGRVDADGLTCWAYDNTGSQYQGALLSVVYKKGANQSYSSCGALADANYAEHYQYTASGQVFRTTTTIDGEEFVTEQYYDDHLRPYYTRYPDGQFVTKQNYNAIGMPVSTVNATQGHRDYGKVYQRLVDVDARGQATVMDYANGVRQTRTYQAETGRIDVLSVSRGSTMLHNLDYTFDAVGNLTQRAHNFGYGGSGSDFCESFTYDNLYRLDNTTVHAGTTSCSGGATATQDMKYDAFGNITYKQGVGTYHYTDVTDKYALKAIKNASGTQTHTFEYDNRGNVESDGSRSFVYTPFDKPSRITKGTIYSEFGYDHNRNLYKRIDQRSEGRTEALYVKGLYERLTLPTGNVERKYYVGDTVVIDSTDTSQNKTLYMHKDHLGSAVTITDAGGGVVQHINYDAWGKQNRFYSSGLLLPLLQQQSPAESKGYTGHKEISGLGIIHMNGRIYDPTLGRFLQADPHIQAPTNSQNYNRYSYVLNNPLSYTDPSGYFFKALGKFVKKYWRVIAAAVVTYFTAGLAAQWATGWAISAGMTTTITMAGASATMLSTAGSIFVGAMSGAIAGAAGGFVATGSLKGAATGALSGAVFGAIGGSFKAYGVENTGVQMAAHATAGGVLSDIQGGKFGHGFISAGIMKGVGKIQTQASYGRVIIQAIAGGTVSRLTGGKFANGAVTSAIQFIVNQLSNYEWNPRTRRMEDLGSQVAARDENGNLIYNHDGTIATRYPGEGGQSEIAFWGDDSAKKVNCAAMQICLTEAAKEVWTPIAMSSAKPRFTLKNGLTVNDFPSLRVQGVGWYVTNGFAPTLVSAALTYYKAAAACSVSEEVIVGCGVE
ncbi:RHS repeat domain-containing protein [Pseudoalteromonas sp. SSDWG2]|uniref:RHS repeat domain-containing protein n=1 Tax=Pseudoalteromonas sp. SSDWG2 TaxID=3139391 RepID=UPI003BAC1706